jgi:hypothetical protein
MGLKLAHENKKRMIYIMRFIADRRHDNPNANIAFFHKRK